MEIEIKWKFFKIVAVSVQPHGETVGKEKQDGNYPKSELQPDVWKRKARWELSKFRTPARRREKKDKMGITQNWNSSETFGKGEQDGYYPKLELLQDVWKRRVRWELPTIRTPTRRLEKKSKMEITQN